VAAQSLSLKQKIGRVLVWLWRAYLLVQAVLALMVLAPPPFRAGPTAISLLGLSSLLAVPLWLTLSHLRDYEASQAEQTSVADEAHHERDTIEVQLGREIVRSRRYGRPFSLLLAVVRPKNGGPLDHAVRDVLRLTEDLVRASDEVGAWSEREVIVILSESSEAQATRLMARLDNHLRTRLPSVEIAFGIATHQPEDSSRTMIARAERAAGLIG
jgi:hypothetical protein